MIIDRTFHNIQCDHCGALLDEETWWDDKDALTTNILPECGWIECEGGRHYCEECWTRDDDDNIVTSDGRKWDDFSHKEILTNEQRYHLDYLKDLLDPKLTLTQLRFEIIKAIHLYYSMVGSIYSCALHDEIDGAYRLLDYRYKNASKAERKIYHSFMDNRVFYNLQKDGFPNDGKDVNIY